MKLCEVCGNPIPDHYHRCPYCECIQSGNSRARSREIIRTINLEEGMPTVEESLIKLERELNYAISAGVCLARIIHGYGSSGVGGDIRNACHRYLREAYQKGRIRGFIPGELLRISTKQGHILLTRYPELKNDEKNRGITIIELSHSKGIT